MRKPTSTSRSTCSPFVELDPVLLLGGGMRSFRNRVVSRLAIRRPFLWRPKVQIERRYSVQASRQERRRDPTLPVVMCTWDRIDRLPRTIELLKNQEGVRPQLFLWNNNRSRIKDVDQILGEAHGLDIEVIHNRSNVGGFGRFFYARELAGTCPFVVFIDDDQEFGPELLGTLAREAAPETICGFWAFNFAGSDYWADRLFPKSGDRVTYCGTGGMVCDTSLFKDSELFTCPARYWFVEDLWLSFFADHVRGWSIVKSNAELTMILDGKDQFLTIHRHKNRFFRHLIDRRGWDVKLRVVNPATHDDLRARSFMPAAHEEQVERKE